MDYSQAELKEIELDKVTISRVKVFKTSINPLTFNKIIKWIAYVYHPNTPLAKLEEDPKIDRYTHRKFVAAKEAEFTLQKGGKFITHYENVILGRHHVVNKMIIAYLKLFNDRIYATLYLQRQSYYNQLAALLDADGIEAKTSAEIKEKAQTVSAVQSTLNTTNKKLEELEILFLQGDNSERMLFDLYQEMELESLGLTPEEIASKIQEGRDPLNYFKPQRI